MTTANFVGLTYDASENAIVIPIEDRVKLRRLADTGPKMVWRPRSSGDRGEPLPPYPSWRDLRTADVLVEGELDALCAIEHGFLAASGTAGAGTWHQEWTDALTGRSVVILYDHDESGREGALKVAKALTRGGCRAAIASWPANKPDRYDVSDFFRDGGDPSEFQAMLDAAVPFELPAQPVMLGRVLGGIQL